MNLHALQTLFLVFNNSLAESAMIVTANARAFVVSAMRSMKERPVLQFPKRSDASNEITNEVIKRDGSAALRGGRRRKRDDGSAGSAA
jgi:hypothetical protein